MLDTEGRKVPATNMFYLFHKYYKEKEAKKENDMMKTQYLMPKLRLESENNTDIFTHRPVIPAPILKLSDKLPVIFEDQ